MFASKYNLLVAVFYWHHNLFVDIINTFHKLCSLWVWVSCVVASFQTLGRHYIWPIQAEAGTGWMTDLFWLQSAFGRIQFYEPSCHPFPGQAQVRFHHIHPHHRRTHVRCKMLTGSLLCQAAVQVFPLDLWIAVAPHYNRNSCIWNN